MSSSVHVPGARLYYEIRASGPLLVMVPGASGVADSFRPVAEHLAEHYTVLIYDRRGFSRSRLEGEQDYEHRLQTDADDVRHLIAHVSDEPATVFGASSGAIVALTALTHHPSVVGTLVPFEPPVMRLLPDGQQWIDFFTELYGQFRRSDVEPALTRFRERSFPASDLQIMAHAPRNDANTAYWFEHELRQYPRVELDFDALAAYADRIVPASGRDGIGYPCHDATIELGARLDRPVIELPGGHVGFLARPATFARDLVHALLRPGDSCAPSPAQPTDKGHPRWSH
jgi:pimeloyl-ACP methyl ester carboxylesterase